MNQQEYEYLMSSKSKFIQMRNVDAAQTNEYRYLGQADAATEWEDNSEVARSLFVDTKTYEDFKNPNSLILLGRTGTGKTAILRCFEDDIEKKTNSDYTYITPLVFDDILIDLASFDDIDNSQAIRVALQQSIKFVLDVAVMKRLIVHYGRHKDLPKIHQYLSDNGLLDSTTLKTKIRNAFAIAATTQGRVSNAANMAIKITDIIDVFNTSSYNQAVQELHSYLANNKMLLLIDTGNEYDARDAKTVTILKALIHDCFLYHTFKSRWHIYVKLALPSEVYTHILQRLPGKQRGNTVIIQWNYTALTDFIAKRIRYYLDVPEYKEYFKFFDEYSLSDFHNHNICADFLSKIFPEECPSSLDYRLNTIAYCIRHTLKKPRELMIIFNALIDKIIERKNGRLYFEEPNMIKDVIHATQEEMIGCALSMYDNSYKDILETCSVVLRNNTYLFKGQEILDRLKEATAYAESHKYEYGADEIKRVLMESGLVGLVSDYKVIPANSDLHNNEDLNFVTARFEYQVKGYLQLDRNDYYVIHPMCYEHFTCYLDKHVLVYVDVNSDPKDLIHTILKKSV